jgi:hypothetical protein
MVANVATVAINARGSLLVNRLQDIPEHAQEITLHGVHHGSSVALAVIKVQNGHDLISMEPGFPLIDDPDMHEDLIEEFGDTAATIGHHLGLGCHEQGL